MKSNNYAVKYMGIVEGSVGCLSRKMFMPSKQDKLMNVVSVKHLKEPSSFKIAPILKSKYTKR